jgi:hypothetical protein
MLLALAGDSIGCDGVVVLSLALVAKSNPF